MRIDSLKQTKKDMAKKERQIIRKGEKNIKNLQNQYKKRTQAIKTQGELNLIKQSAQNEQSLKSDLIRHENALEKLNKSLKEGRKAVETEKQFIKKKFQEAIEENQRKQQKKLLKQKEIFSKKIDQGEREARKIEGQLTQDRSEKLKDLNFETRSLIRDRNSRNSQALYRQRHNFERERIRSLDKFQERILLDKIFQQNKILSQKNEYDLKLKDLKNQFEFQKNLQKKQFHQDVQTADKDFKKKYTHILKNHRENILNLTQRTQNDLLKLKKSLADQKTPALQKKDDPFYHIKLLRPIIENHKDHYTVTLEVPEYEKEFVKVSGKERTIRITHSRRFEDGLKGENGSLNSYKKYESYGRVFTLKDLIDPTKIKQTYKDGIMTFSIMKR